MHKGKIKILLVIEQPVVAYKYFEHLAKGLSQCDDLSVEIFNLFPDEDINARLSKVCRKLYSLPEKRSYKKQIGAITRIIRQADADIIHAHESIPAFYAAIALMLSFFSKKLIFHRHHSFYRGWVMKMMERVAFFRCNLSLSVSKTSLKQAQQEHPFSKRKTDFVYNGITMESNEGPLPVDITGKPYVITMIAWLIEGKGHVTAIEAIDIVRKTFPDVLLIFAGEGALRSSLQKFINEKGLKQNIIMPGSIQNIPLLLEKSAISILPSEAEAFNLSILETMAAKRLSIASDIPSIRECITNESTGVLIAPNDPLQLADSIIHYLSHPNQRNKIAENGYRNYQENFTTEKMVAEIIKRYKKLLHITT
jgi:glycosyltransferase involved in cell wall biosynthesis